MLCYNRIGNITNKGTNLTGMLFHVLGGVTLAHVSGSSKNAADEKLRESMKRFVDTHGMHI